ncbi:hypothetical protein KI387_042857, partial [Taxus chinensis]
MEAGGNGGRRAIGDLSSGTIDEAAVLIWWPTFIFGALLFSHILKEVQVPSTDHIVQDPSITNSPNLGPFLSLTNIVDTPRDSNNTIYSVDIIPIVPSQLSHFPDAMVPYGGSTLECPLALSTLSPFEGIDKAYDQ